MVPWIKIKANNYLFLRRIMITEVIHYQHDGVEFKGYLSKPDVSLTKRPAILVVHAWRGQDDFARQKTEEIANLGYVGFAADLYGNGIIAKDDEEAMQLMLPLFLDRKLLRDRINAALVELKKQSCVNAESIGAIGFCFGGLTVIELLRSGAPVKGVVSFHGLLGNVLDKYKAIPIPCNQQIKGSLLILHGYQDPFNTDKDLEAIQEELTATNIDWQMNIYGRAMHAFSNPQAHHEEAGMVYNQQAAERSWLAMKNFFNEIFCS